MTPARKTRVLFFAWGDSIHTRRRIGIFTTDPAFEVGVVSTFAYEFENAQNYYLSGARGPVRQGSHVSSFLGRAMIGGAALLLGGLLLLLGKRVSFHECRVLLRDALLVRRYGREFVADVIVLQTLFYPSYLSFLLGGKTPVVITFWNGDITWWAKWTGIERAFKRRIVSHGVNRAAAITVNSAATLEACLAYGVSPDRVKLIRYPGVNLELFRPQPDKQSARERLGLRHQNVVLCPRGVGGYLNSDVIIDAAAKVIGQYPDTLFLFLSGVGGGATWAAHQQRAAELGIAENIRRDGQVSWQTMPLYYRSADVMVSVSSNDSLPNCMLESMACGIPLVMGDIPQIREWIMDGENGYCVPPRDAATLADRIVRVFSQRGAVERFVEKNLERVRREVDSRVVGEAIKRLVRETAHEVRR